VKSKLNSHDAARRLTVGTAAKRLGVSRWTIHKRIKDGHLPAEQIEGGQYLIDANDLERPEVKARKNGRPKKAK
jgi:excisionase family DNA binding protein